MATHHPQLARLQIPQQPSPPIPQPLYTPGLPTVIQQSFNMHTPLQSNFGAQIPPHPHPRHGMHRAHPSLMFSGPAAVLAAAGIAPPSGMPVAPASITPHLMLGGPGFHRGSRRTASISTGGPPKAPLGGPNRKHSPMPAGPPAAASSTVSAASEKAKTKKVNMKLPVERAVQSRDEDNSVPYSLWSRRPLAHSICPRMDSVEPPDITSMNMHPIEQANSLPATIDVFLPGKAVWDECKQKLIEEKLRRLGVERGGNSVPSGQLHIHGRAASISSPADPALLLFKLNKLQQSQSASASVSPQPSSVPVSPQPPLPPRFQNATSKHGHSFSLANFTTPLPQQQQFYPTASFNPFGPGAILGSDQIAEPDRAGQQRDSSPHLHAPQGIAPVSLNMQSDTATASSGPSRVASTIPDFNRGFGVDIPEEDEEDLETFGQGDGVAGALLPEEGDDETNEVEDDSMTAPAHSRHISRVSVALSLKSMGGRSGNLEVEDSIEAIDENAPPELERPVEWTRDDGSNFRLQDPSLREADFDADPVGEWTASEDERSLGEYSNPSDEERALQVRQARREAKARQRAYKDQETPRRLPDFPPPPGGPGFVHHAPSTADEDIVSNPSEECEAPGRGAWLHPGHRPQELAQYQPVIDGQLRSPRPLPPLPHSRTASGNHSLHSAAVIHSRHGSSMLNEIETATLLKGATAVQMTRRESLNPLAKPFVFGAGTFGVKTDNILQPQASTAVHSRHQSWGRALNAAAAEFRPTGFTFRPPEGVPTLSFNASELSEPLPQVPAGVSPSRFQGREKRQRRGSSIDQEEDREDQEEEESDEREMSSFRFPPSRPSANSSGVHTQTATAARAISPLPKHHSELNATAPPFQIAATSAPALSFAAREPSTLQHPLTLLQSATGAPIPTMQTQSEPGVAVTPEAETKEFSSETAPSMHPSPSPLRKRPPVLDIKHPVSTNTVPAALFRKAVVGTDIEGPTRPSVRSRLSSREIFDHMNSLSLDDTNVPTISRKLNLPHTHPVSGLQSRIDTGQDRPVDVFAPATNHNLDSREQMLQVPTSAIVSPVSEPMHTSHVGKRDEADQIDQRIEDLLDDRMEVIKKDLVEAQALATDQVVGQVITAIRTHFSEMAIQRLDEGSRDAPGETDFELVLSSLNQSVMDIRTSLRHDLEEILSGGEMANISRDRPGSAHSADFQRVMEEFGNRTVSAVTNAVVKFASRIDQIEEFARVRAADERELLLSELFAVLAPRLESFRQQPIDFDVVTAKLAEAVKPHISQLIDLTSDKKETAGLIVQRLMPALSALSQNPAHVDTDAIVSQLRVEIARMTPASDPHVIKEAVADLVVERLDSRLAVREKSASSEHLYSRISERIDDLHVPVSDVRKAIEDLRMGQESIREQGTTLNSLHQDMAAHLLSLPGAVMNATKTIQAAKEQWATLKNDSAPIDTTGMLTRLESIESTIHNLTTNHEYLTSQAASLISLHENLKVRILDLPQSVVEVTESLKQAQAEFLSQSRSADQSLEVKNLLASNAELQIQIAKARGAHGQIRVEKDLMSDRMAAAESERDSLRTQLEELKSKGVATETEVTAAGLRITELEDALSHALARLQSVDVTSQAKEDRIAVLERQNRDSVLEQYQYKSQVQKLELQAEWITRDKETLEQRLSQLQKDHDALANQQSHWEELRRTSEQVEQLTRLIGAADSEEVAQLKRERDRCKILEGEHTSLQRRFKEQETKFVNHDRAAQTTRQNLAQAQQRASEWEKKANELQAEVDTMQARLDDADEAKMQLESDLSLTKLHLEEKDAAENVTKEREVKMRAEMSSLEIQLVSLKSELEKAKQARLPVVVTPSASVSPGWQANGYTNGQDARPSSRTSTVYGGRSPVTPTDVAYRSGKFPSRAPSVAPDSPKGVWGSMHAPRAQVHRTSDALPYPSRSAIPSPTPSTVSLAPTQGDDGWWS